MLLDVYPEKAENGAKYRYFAGKCLMDRAIQYFAPKKKFHLFQAVLPRPPFPPPLAVIYLRESQQGRKQASFFLSLPGSGDNLPEIFRHRVCGRI